MGKRKQIERRWKLLANTTRTTLRAAVTKAVETLELQVKGQISQFRSKCWHKICVYVCIRSYKNWYYSILVVCLHNPVEKYFVHAWLFRSIF